jgi:UDP-glucuronate decarboxylase
MNSDYTSPINIGNPTEFTMLQLAELVRNKINPRLSIIHKDLPQDDPMQRQPIIELAKKELNWQPQIELESGLDQTINYFKGKLVSQ